MNMRVITPEDECAEHGRVYMYGIKNIDVFTGTDGVPHPIISATIWVCRKCMGRDRFEAMRCAYGEQHNPCMDNADALKDKMGVCVPPY